MYPASDEFAGLDIYVAGFPCQAFSSCGLSAGLMDARGCVWLPIFRFIAIALPRAAILENVLGLTQGRLKATFDMMMSLLESMKEYDWHTKCLNTQDYGVPQNRPRIYIVGIRQGQHGSEGTPPFAWPEVVEGATASGKRRAFD